MKKIEHYKDYIISKGGIEYGILWSDIKEKLLTPAKYNLFLDFMEGQTVGNLPSTELPIVYVEDFEKFIKGYKSND